ncbi:plus-3-domain-containing protein [Macrolepiota fuliginosa MF-IS2]|uniref:Plus-3-domain-containing protein n=1 Tax=Macrolepiota fuliginosa MF-IS2 TaxID=1400762 RepID=A0A9P5X004_9AGAR|nr:plus-3-domain-containing protein [Macrolepiota fuliginosa MF-IS2]
MSDLDDEILELAGAGEKKRKKSHSSKSNKRRKEDPMATSEEEPAAEGEKEEDDPYPLDGKYKDEYDRQLLLQMSEVEREEILSQRLEEKQQLLDKRLLSQMVQQQRGGGTDDSVAKAAKRQHAVRGATKEKSNKLAELKAKRKAKDERKRNTSPKRDRSSSPMDMEISDGESEDGQITKFEQEEEKVGRIFNKASSENEPITVEDLERCRLTRDLLAKHALSPWFEDYVKGAWVRYLIGQEDGPVYRICEIQNLSADFVKPYNINEKMINQALELKHGKSVRVFHMDKVSNGAFSLKEFERLKATCTSEEVKLPTKRDLEHKATQLHKLPMQPVTESDINAMLARKSQLQSTKSSGMTTMERSRLNQARTLALRRNDLDEMAEIDAQLAALGTPTKPRQNEEAADLLTKVNERNRKANMEAVRKAELAESERKRRERKLAAAGASVPVHDPSARLKTVPRMFNSATPTTSRPGTPGGTPQPVQSVRASPLPPSVLSGKSNGSSKTFEASVIDAVEVDLGDF